MAAGDPLFTVHQRDVRDASDLLHEVGGGRPFITCTVTSPPYADLIDYGGAGQIGRGQTYDEYLNDCREVFTTTHRYTVDDGALWIVADTVYDQSKTPSMMRALPFDLARVAQEAGWTLRETVVWDKEKTRPWSGRGRFRNTFEYVLFFVKTNAYKYHVDRLRDPIQLEQWWVQYPERYNPQGKAPTNLWRISIPVQGTWSNTAVQHACPLPPDLVERILLLSTDNGDVVYDPFAGSGTVVAEAERLERHGLGIELNSKYVVAYRNLVRPEILERRGDDVLQNRLAVGASLQETILNLRAVKYPKTLVKSYMKAHPDGPKPQCAIALAQPGRPDVLRNKHQLLEVTSVLVVSASQEERQNVQQHLKETAARQPLTGFGVDGDILVVAPGGAEDAIGAAELYLYEHGRTWKAARTTTVADLLTQPASSKRGGYLPIASNVYVDETPRRIYA